MGGSCCTSASLLSSLTLSAYCGKTKVENTNITHAHIKGFGVEQKKLGRNMAVSVGLRIGLCRFLQNRTAILKCGIVKPARYNVTAMPVDVFPDNKQRQSITSWTVPSENKPTDTSLERLRDSIQRRWKRVIVTFDTDSDTASFIGRSLLRDKGIYIENMRRNGVDVTISSDHLILKSDNLQKLSKALEQVQQEIEEFKKQNKNLLSERIIWHTDPDVSDFVCRLLVGKRGNYINRVSEQFGVIIEVHSHKDGNDSVEIKSDDPQKLLDAVEFMTHKIEKMKEKYWEEEETRPNLERIILQLDKDQTSKYFIFSHVIGTGGRNVKKIENMYGVSIQKKTIDGCDYLDVVADDPNKRSNAVKHLKKEIEHFKEQNRRNNRVPGLVAEKITLDTDQCISSFVCNGLLQRRGQNIQRIRNKYGVRVHITLHEFVEVKSSDPHELRCAVECLKQEIERFTQEYRNLMKYHSSRKNNFGASNKETKKSYSGE